MTTDDYYNAGHAERDRMVAEARGRLAPPAARTHRGKPRLFTIEGHHAATKPDRTPTHRKPGVPVVPEHMGWFYRGKTSA